MGDLKEPFVAVPSYGDKDDSFWSENTFRRVHGVQKLKAGTHFKLMNRKI